MSSLPSSPPHRATWTLRAFALASALLVAAPALAAGGKPATKLVNVADTRHVSGISLWIAQIYNTSYLLYGLLVVAVMVSMGVVLGLVCDRAVATLGIDLGRMHHHE